MNEYSSIALADAPRGLLPEVSRLAVAMGIFDGVHLGHQAIITALHDVALETDATPVALFFAPHPKEVLGYGSPQILTTPHHKARLLLEAGAERIVCVRFTVELSKLSPEEFLERFFVADGMTVTAFCVGSNWRFGHGNSGDASLLAAWSESRSIRCVTVPQVCHDGSPICSTRIRAAVESGNLDDAAKMLGRRFSVNGIVRHGNGIAGGSLSCPTANISEANHALPPYGVYAARAYWDGRSEDGIVYVGEAPTIRNDNIPLVEMHLFNATGDLYGVEMTVEFHAFLRKSMKFNSVTALEAQIRQDIAEARKCLAEGPGRHNSASI
ncbi:MAG: riboflavin biosynthesis protein RibF [Victivallales bacterium]|nr:riboflavin biosynthesis protein RibF [Victivallales bacterium]